MNFERTMKNLQESHESHATEVHPYKSLHFLHEQLLIMAM
jgi:hypothetical protein